MIERLIHLSKGILMFVGFVGFALSILSEPNVDVQAQFIEHGINPSVFAALFVLAGFAALTYGLKNWRWNGLIFAPYFVFAGFAIEATAKRADLSGSTATAYLLLGGLLALEFIIDNDMLRGFLNGRGNG